MSNRLRAVTGSTLAALTLATPAVAAPTAPTAAPGPGPSQRGAGAVTAHAARACGSTNVMPSRRNIRAVRRSVLCLVNAQRRAHGLRPLRASRKLERAAQRHSRDMVARRYFSHTSPSGRDGGSRISAAHYRFSMWGENIAWGQGGYATPAQTVQSWMNSAGHRANILNGRFRHSGIGVAVGTPVGGGGATYTHDFGRS